MTFAHTFYEDEVRCDFYIPSIIKRTWAAQLQILADLDKVCRENDIKYFAEWGTLLGTVRHAGFIPWDDDMDICMKRKDYNKFLALVDKVLPGNYYIVNYRTSSTFKQSLSRIVSSDHYRFDLDYLSQYSGLPFPMGIDIFPMDYLTDDEEYENQRREKIYYLQSVLDMLETDGRSIQEILPQIEAIERHYHIKLSRNKQARVELHDIIEQTYGEVEYEDAKYITLYPVWYSNRNYQFPKEYYDYCIEMPFENMHIPVPIFYNDILRKKYGASYMTPVRSGGAHDYPYYEIHMEVLRNSFDFEWPAYKYSAYDAHHVGYNRKPTFSAIMSDCLKKLHEYHNVLLRDNNLMNCEIVQEFLQECQSIAIDMGTMIEKRYHEGSVTVSVLEKYCEALYELGLCTDKRAAMDMVCNLTDILSEFENSYRSEFADTRLVLYITYSAEQFKTMESEIRFRLLNENNVTIKIMPIPVHKYDASFRLIEDEYDIGAYPDDLDYINYQDFNLDIHPEEIITGYPYDGYGLITEIDSKYYARNLWENTDKLIYIPFFTLKSIDKNDQRLHKNLRLCINTPINIIADEIRVSDEETKECYKAILSEFADERDRDIVIGKLSVTEHDGKIIHERKRVSEEESMLLFYVGINSFIPNPDIMIDKIEKVFRIITDSEQKITLLYKEQDGMREAIREYFAHGDDLNRKIDSVLNDYKNSIKRDETLDVGDSDYFTTCCAYYGEASYLVHDFMNNDKPAMIMDVNI